MQKKKRYVVALNECEYRRLAVYADTCGIDRPAALMRLVRQSLRKASGLDGSMPTDDNQLRLFDSVQIDIFNNTTKANNKDFAI